MISVLHATRGRPGMAVATQRFWMERAADPSRVEWLFGVDADDKPSQDTLSTVAGATVVINTGPTSNVAAMNASFRASRGDVIIQCSDDYYPPPRWDEIILAYLDPSKPLVLGSGDPIGSPVGGCGEYSGDGLLTQVCATRAYLNQIGGFVFNPEFDGMVADFWFTQKAAVDDVLIDAYSRVHFIHDWHGGVDDPKRDKTYYDHMTTEKNRQGWNTWAAQQFACMPDVIVHDDGVDRLDAQRAARLLGCLELAGTKGISAGVFEEIIGWRRQYGGAAIENLPPKDEARRLFLAGDFKGARAAIEPQLRRLQHGICGGRFRYHFGVWLWDICTRQIGDRPEMGCSDDPPR